MDPFRRDRLGLADEVAQLVARLHAEKDVDVVRHAAERDQGGIPLTEERRHVGVEVGLQPGVDEPDTLPGAEDDVEQNLYERRGHRGILPGFGAGRKRPVSPTEDVKNGLGEQTLWLQ